MSILKVARMGHPVLRKKAKELDLEEIKSEKIQKLIADMKETMLEYDGIGLAAPQVYESVRLVVVGMDMFDKDSGPHPENTKQVIINPVVKVLDNKKIGNWDGCLSLPDLLGYVERPRKIKVTFQDEKGEKHSTVLQGFRAICAQHEFDHLDGILYVDRISDRSKLSFAKEFYQHHSGSEG